MMGEYCGNHVNISQLLTFKSPRNLILSYCHNPSLLQPYPRPYWYQTIIPRKLTKKLRPHNIIIESFKNKLFFKCTNIVPNAIVMNGNIGTKYLGPHPISPAQV